MKIIIFLFVNLILLDSTAPIKSSNKIIKENIKAPVNWIGTWTFEDTSVEYTLKIDEKYRGANLCTYTAKGVQTWHELDCRGVDKGNSFELYYGSVIDGSFGMGGKIDSNKPVLTLKLVNGKVVTYWNQFINNYEEEGNRSGKVCFKKVK